MKHLLPLENRIIGRLDFKLTSTLHIGSGEEFLKVEEKLVIPASSIKGTFRALAEKLQKSIQTSEPPSDYFEIGEGRLKLRKEEKEKAVKWFLDRVSERGDLSLLKSLGYHDELQHIEKEKDLEALKPQLQERIVEDYATIYHPLYRLFGGEKIASKIRFLDVLLNPHRVKLIIKPGIAIDRKSGKVEEHLLAFFEAIEPMDTQVNLWFIADNLSAGGEEAKLLAGVLDMVRKLSLSLGARKTAGMGRMELREGEFWMINLKRGEEVFLANPFRKKSTNLEGILSYLLGMEK